MAHKKTLQSRGGTVQLKQRFKVSWQTGAVPKHHRSGVPWTWSSCCETPATKLRACSLHSNLVVPRTCRRIGDRAFYVVAPWAWNRLLTELKQLRSMDSFLRELKKFLFHSVNRRQDTDWLCDVPSVFC